MANHEKHIDDLLKDALGDYTELPPAGAWNDMQNRLANADGAERIDDVLQDALGNYTEVPPAAAWADMERRLDKKERRRRPFAWFWYAAAVTGVLLVAYMFIDNHESDTAFRRKGASEEVATPTAVETNNTPGNVTPAIPQQEQVVKETQVVASPEELNKEEVKKGATPAAVVKTTPVQKKAVATSPAQKPAPIVKGDAPLPTVKDTQEKEQKVAAHIPAPQETKDIRTQVEEVAKEEDDIAHAIKRRGPGSVMNVIRSRYADSMARVEKELARLAEEKAAAEKAAKALPPVLATTPIKKVEVVKEEPAKTKRTIDPLAQNAIDKTEQNLLTRQDAIPGSGIKTPVEPPEFQEADGITAANAATNDPEIGSLAAFIGPRQDTSGYGGTWAATDESLPADFVRVRKPLNFDVFMKFGFETGTSNYKAGKYVFAPTLRANISDKFSLIFQPAFKMGNTNFSRIGKDETFHSIESSYMDSIKSFTKESNAQGIISEHISATYYYQESYDSVVISRSLRSSRVVEADLPLMLNYKVAKGLSVYGGPVVAFSNMLQIDEKINTYKTETRRDTISYYVPLNSKAPTATPIREVFPFTGRDSSNAYMNAPYSTNVESKVRFGYMLGISYNYKRFSADLSVQQNISRLNYIPNVSVRNIYLQPYTRFMIGYRLNNKKK